MRRPLILLFGMPRSGTTWIAKVLDSHPDTLYRHEPDAHGSLNHVPWVADAHAGPDHREALRAYAAQLVAVNTARVSGSLPIFPKRYLSGARYHAYRTSVWVARIAEQIRRPVPVLAALPPARRDETTVVWKSVESLTRLGALVRALDPCRAVVIVRHPCGQIASGLRGESLGKFGDAGGAAEDWGIFELLVATEAARRRDISLRWLKGQHPLERLAWKWVLQNETALEAIDGVEGCVSLRYEDLCDAPERRARELLSFCGLDWHEQTAEFVHRSTGEHRESYYSVFKDPVRAAGRWRRQLAPADVERIHGVVEQSALGRMYPADAPSSGTGATLPDGSPAVQSRQPANCP